MSDRPGNNKPSLVEQIDLNADDDITLFTDDEQVLVRTINRTFQQRSRLKGVDYEFTIFNDNQCYQKVTRRHGGKHKFRINLGCLDPQPRREYNLADSWLVFAGICAILTFLLVYAGWIRNPPVRIDRSLLYILTSFSVSACVISLLLAILKTRDTLVLYSKCGRAPVLELINNNPDHKAFTDFLDDLSRRILLSRKNMSESITQMLALELKELRRLRNEGVILDSQYEAAKQRIFKHEAYNPSDAS
jgi:hypothetical protein